MANMKSLTACLLLFASMAFAESHEELIERAFEALEDDLSAHWSYTHTQEDSEGLFVAHYDPRLPEAERWRLISVDGREPTEDETEDYLEQRSEEQEQKQEQDSGDDDYSFRLVAKEGSTALVEETESYWLFSFEPAPDSEDEREMMESVHGRLKVIKDGHYVAEIK